MLAKSVSKNTDFRLLWNLEIGPINRSTSSSIRSSCWPVLDQNSNFKHQLSEQLTDHCTCTQPICKLHTQLHTLSPYYYVPSCSYASQYIYLHIIICTSITPILKLNWNYFSFYCLFIAYSSTFAHTVHRFFYFSFILCYRLYICLCVTLCCCFCHTDLLYLGQVAVVNYNLFSTGLSD